MQNIVLNISKQQINIYQKDCWIKRGDNTIELIKKAFEIIKNINTKEINLSINLSDHYDASSYCTCGPIDRIDYLVPCWSFHSWPECGIYNYDSTCKKIMDSGKEDPIYDKIFWIGSVITNPIRGKLLEINNTSKKFEFVDSGFWIGEGKTSKKYISLQDHTKYRFLLDVCGNGYSARAKFLFFSQRPVFYQMRESNEYWFYKMRPFEHYIPLEHDLSDLNEKIDWIDKKPDIEHKIVKNAIIFAKNNLTQNNAINRYCELLLNY